MTWVKDKVTDFILDIAENLLIEINHDTKIFPEDSDEYIDLTAGGTANIFSDWAELQDNNAVTFTSKVGADGAHISSVLIEDLDTDDKIYIMELGYGDGTGPGTTTVLRHRFMAGNAKKLDAIQQIPIRIDHIPAGSTVYWRMKCETLSAVCRISIRYHHHN